MAKTSSTPKAAGTARPKKAAAGAPGARPEAPAATRPANGTVTVTLIRSTIGFDRKQAAVVRGLGLRRIRHAVEVPDTPETRGMIHKVRHLVEVS